MPQPNRFRGAMVGVAAWMTFGLAGALGAEPLDLTDPTPRSVDVTLENSGEDHPGRLDQSYGPPVRGWFRPGPEAGQATVSIPAKTVEGMMVGYTPVSGSFTDFVWVFDVATGHVLSATFSGVVLSQVDMGFFGTEVKTDLAIRMATAKPAGFRAPEERFGHRIFAFCEDASPSCHRIEPAPFDATTGYVNAVGSVTAAAIGGLGTETFSPMGEARFLEAPTASAVSAAP